MKKLIALLFLLLSHWHCHSQTEDNSQQGLTWQSDVSKAYALSASTHKPIFAFFTGSDWCGWCHKLQKEVFAKPAFIKWASDNVVLLELDFPRRKQLPPELVQQNQALQQFFKVTGFPTIWMFSMNQDTENKRFLISALGTLGYPRDPEIGKEEVKFLEDANVVLAKER
jgi:thioredoxin-related protein